ncbi:MAG: DUF2959 domain-containing protein [Porticoccaceae bacterium]|nr:DUF2959 domain-containing protein [Pseudomonadales bacterium]MCP5172906.1 DUF2959 domain-containing protein [Pseudomonadales bacterium]MCP5302380.1 DUF2959 domain-containing protein [Pseudomonadales bacterium]
MKRLIAGVVLIILAGCETAYYGAWEKLGVEKRDILVDRIENTQEAQQEAQEEFKDALEQYRAVVNFDGGDLEKLYNRLSAEYEDSEAAAKAIAKHIESVERVAEDLFDEWQREIGEIQNASLRNDSNRKLRDTRRKYRQLIASMRSAEKSVYPVLTTLKDQVLYLKHNLNAQAIASLKGELRSIDADVNRLVAQMQRSIDEANDFINRLK